MVGLTSAIQQGIATKGTRSSKPHILLLPSYLLLMPKERERGHYLHV